MSASPPRLTLVLVLGAMVALGPLTFDMYLPALPDIEEDLSTTAAAVQLTLTGTLVGLAVGQLVVGPLSDAFGRRRPIVVGTLLHVAASLGCLVAPTVAVLGALRVVQGIGASATAVVTMAVVRDLYTGDAAARLLSRLMLVLGVVPVLAPSIGGAVLQWTSWRGVFGVLAVAATGLAVLGGTALPETLPPTRRRAATPGGIARAYVALFRDPRFVGLVLVSGFSMAAMFSYVSGSSFVLQDEFGLTEQQFGVAFGAGAVFLIGGTQLAALLLRWWTSAEILRRALIGSVLASLALFTVSTADVGGLPGLLAPLWLVMLFTGLTMPSAPALALSRHGEAAGTAAALLGAVRYGVGAAAAPFVGILGNDAAAMSTVILVGMTLALVTLVTVARPHEAALLAPDIAPVD